MKSFVLVFKDPNKLNSMLELRRLGWTYKSLALIYGVDHSSIYKACKIRNIQNPNATINLNISRILDLFNIQTPKEKMYKDYLEEQRRRRLPKLYSLTPNI